MRESQLPNLALTRTGDETLRHGLGALTIRRASANSFQNRLAPLPLEGKDGRHRRHVRRLGRFGDRLLAVGRRTLLHEQVVDGPLEPASLSPNREAPNDGRWRVKLLVGEFLTQ